MAIDMTDPTEIVQHGSRVFERIEETDLPALQASLAKAAAVVQAGRAAGMAGKLRGTALEARIRTLIAFVEAEVYAIHAECTAIAREAGVEPPQPRGGGDR